MTVSAPNTWFFPEHPTQFTTPWKGFRACWKGELSFALIQGFVQGSVHLCCNVRDFSVFLSSVKERRINLFQVVMVGSISILLGQLVHHFATNPYYKLRKQTQKTAHQCYFSSQLCPGLFLNRNTFISHAVLCLIAYMIFIFLRKEPQTRMGRV